MLAIFSLNNRLGVMFLHVLDINFPFLKFWSSTCPLQNGYNCCSLKIIFQLNIRQRINYINNVQILLLTWRWYKNRGNVFRILINRFPWSSIFMFFSVHVLHYHLPIIWSSQRLFLQTLQTQTIPSCIKNFQERLKYC